MKLKYKINFALLLNLALVSTGLLYLFYFWSKYEIENKLEDLFRYQTNQVSSQLNTLFNSRINETENMAFQLKYLGTTQDLKKIENLLFNNRNTLKAYQSIAFYDAHGIKRVDTNRININKSKLSNDLDNNSKSYYLIRYDNDTKTKVISFYRKIFNNKQTKLLGYLEANIPFSSLTNIINKLNDKDRKNIYGIVLYKESGEIIYSSNSKQILPKLNSNNRTEKNFNFISNQDSFLATYKFNSSVNNLSNNWLLLIEQPKQIAFARIYNNLLILLTCSFYIIYIAAIAYFNLAHRIFKPIENLNSAIKDAEKGNFTTLNQLEITNDEIGDLIRSTKEMTQKIDNLVHEQAIRNRLSVIGKMASGIAHEINNPLHLINNHANIVYRVLSKNEFNLTCDLDRARVTKSIRVINQTVNRISDVVSSLKSISKEHDFEPIVEIPINSIFDRIFVLCKEKLSNFEIKFELVSKTNNKTINCRPGQLQHAILNLINNSIDAVKDLDEKWIKITVDIDDQLIIQVTNSGPKIEKDVAKNLFNPLFTTKVNNNGIGLGLSISKQIITNLNGKIFYDYDDSYTTFIIKVPLSQIEHSETLKVS